MDCKRCGHSMTTHHRMTKTSDRHVIICKAPECKCIQIIDDYPYTLLGGQRLELFREIFRL